MNVAYNCDCMDLMARFPDKFFDLAIVDPPYGIGAATFGMGGTKDAPSTARRIYKNHSNINKSKSTYSGTGKLAGRTLNNQAAKFEQWDITPPQEYFTELFRVSQNQIIWGGNYFDLPPCRCFVCWDKCQPWPNFSQCELAWTSFPYPAKLFRFDNRQGHKIHATQKPVQLYSFLLQTFLPQGGKVLDTHLGSGSSRIAAFFHPNTDFYASEIDKDYFLAQEQRFAQEALNTVHSDSATFTQLPLF